MVDKVLERAENRYLEVTARGETALAALIDTLDGWVMDRKSNQAVQSAYITFRSAICERGKEDGVPTKEYTCPVCGEVTYFHATDNDCMYYVKCWHTKGEIKCRPSKNS